MRSSQRRSSDEERGGESSLANASYNLWPLGGPRRHSSTQAQTSETYSAVVTGSKVPVRCDSLRVNPDLFGKSHIVMARIWRTFCALTPADRVSAAIDTSMHSIAKAQDPGP